MKILAIYPGLNPTFDEVAFALPPLIAQGCKVRVITTRMSMLKSNLQCGEYEDFNGVEIFRPYSDPDELTSNPLALQGEVMRLVDEFSPELLFLNSFRSLPVSRLIRRHHRVPTLLRMETAAPLSFLQRRYYLGWPRLGRIVGRAKWHRVAAEVDVMMINDPGFLPDLVRLGVPGRPAVYAGHCAEQPEGWQRASERDRGEMIYVGSLVRHKNCSAWLDSVPAILENTPVEQFTVIGRGPSEHVIETLRKRYGDHVRHIPEVPRREALERLSAAYFAYTECCSGWGLLCDAWSTRTPVLCPQSTFGIVLDVTGMMPQSREALVETINRLYSDADYYRALQEGGVNRFNAEHTAEVVSRQYLAIFKQMLEHGPGSHS